MIVVERWRWWCGALLLVACGGEDAGVCRDPAAHAAVDGPFAEPADFDEGDCVDGSLAGFDPSGLWFIEESRMSFFRGGGPVRFALSCEAGLGVELGTFTATAVIEDAYVDDDRLFFRRERRFDGGALVVADAYDVCRRDPDGSLAGWAAHCVSTAEGEDCDGARITLRPFGRLPGESEADGLELVAEYTGEPDAPWPSAAFTANVRVAGGIAYVARGSDGLRIVDVADPAAPRELGWLELPEDDVNDVKIVTGPGGGVFALLASDARGFLVVRVTDPSAPELVQVLSPSGQPNHGLHTLFTERIGETSYAYLADGFTHVVTIWDVTDPVAPRKVGQVEAPSEDWAVHDLYAEGGRLYLNATTGGLLIVDTQPDPAAPELVGQFLPDVPVYSHSNWVTTAAGRRVSIVGDEGYTAHFRVVDVDPDSPDFLRELGSYQTRPEVSAHNVMAVGDRAYAAYYQDGIRVIDLADPMAPTELAYFNTWSPETAIGGRFEGAVGLDVDPDAGLVYVADSPRGLLILRETR